MNECCITTKVVISRDDIVLRLAGLAPYNIRVCVRVYILVCVRVYIRVCVRVYIRVACVCIYTHACVFACTRIMSCICLSECVCVCVVCVLCACVCVRVCMCVCVCGHVHVLLLTVNVFTLQSETTKPKITSHFFLRTRWLATFSRDITIVSSRRIRQNNNSNNHMSIRQC